MMRFDLPESSNGATGATGAVGATVAPCSGRCYSPLCNRGVAASHRTTAPLHRTAPWPPAEYALPDALDEIEQGQRTQRELFPEQADDTRAGRLARILAGVPGVVRADRLPPPPRGAKSLVSIGSEPPCNDGTFFPTAG